MPHDPLPAHCITHRVTAGSTSPGGCRMKLLPRLQSMPQRPGGQWQKPARHSPPLQP